MMALTDLNNPVPVAPPTDMDAPWYIVLTQPQQDLTTVWRLHEFGLEMYVPLIRKRVKTGRTGRNGQKVTRIIPKPMFPGYGFLRATETSDPSSLVWNERQRRGVRGVRKLHTDVNGIPYLLPHAAVMAVFRKQNEEHQEFIAAHRNRRFVPYKRGDKVRIDEPGSAYDGLLGNISNIDARGRLEILKGIARVWVPADKVVAA